MKVTLDLPDEWRGSLPAGEDELAEIVVAGLRRRRGHARHEISHLADVVDTLAELPSPQEVLALHASPALSERIEFLLAKKRHEGFAPEEAAEWDEIMRVEHLVRVAKAQAALKLKAGADVS
jgi:hypothetical protein